MYMIKPNWNWKSNLQLIGINNYDGIALHHMDHSTASYWDVDSWHKENGWAGIGYNYWIPKIGGIVECRGLNYPAGVKNHNYHLISIGFQGDYQNHDLIMPQAQLLSGLELIQWLRARMKNLKIIDGHKRWNDTTCPGQHFPIASFQNGVDTVDDGLLKKGSKGEKVTELQKMLKEIGYDIKVDGDYGPNTEYFVRHFQNNMDLNPDAMVGIETLAKLIKTVSSLNDDTIHIVVNGVDINSSMSTKPIMKDSRVFVPVRAICEKLGYNVSWDAASKTVNITK